MLDPERARRIRLLALDVDGVLTDNGLWMGRAGGERVELKRFDVQDGLGIVLLRQTEVEVIWVSARPSTATLERARDLRIDTVLQPEKGRKAPAVAEVLDQRGIDWQEVAYVGDDLADLDVMGRVGLPIAVANAVTEIRELACYVTKRSGGHGAVREAIEALLRARGEWPAVVARFVGEAPA